MFWIDKPFTLFFVLNNSNFAVAFKINLNNKSLYGDHWHILRIDLRDNKVSRH